MAFVAWLLLSCAGGDPAVVDTERPDPAVPQRPGRPSRRIRLPDRADATYVGRPGAGFRVQGLGDLDGDGADEVGVAEIYTTVDGAPGAGSVQLLMGDPDPPYAPGIGAVWYGAVEGEWLGADALEAGDFDRDGDAELLIGGFGYRWVEDPLQGGSVAARAGGSFSGDGAGRVGDVDGDGRDDLALASGAGREPAEVRVWLGPPDAAQPDFALAGSAEARFGATIGLGDLDGDGADEIAVGAPNAGGIGQGAVFVYDAQDLPRGQPVFTIEGRPEQRVGAAVEIPGDIDGDGLADLLVGAFANDGSGGCGDIRQRVAGALFLGPGRGGTLDHADARFTWDGPGCASLGEALGDLDGDRLAEIALRTDETAWIFFEAPSGEVRARDASLRAEGPVGCCSLGTADVDGDGAGDLIFGRPSPADPYGLPGEVYLLLGPFP